MIYFNLWLLFLGNRLINIINSYNLLINNNWNQYSSQVWTLSLWVLRDSSPLSLKIPYSLQHHIAWFFLPNQYQLFYLRLAHSRQPSALLLVREMLRIILQELQNTLCIFRAIMTKETITMIIKSNNCNYLDLTIFGIVANESM